MEINRNDNTPLIGLFYCHRYGITGLYVVQVVNLSAFEASITESLLSF